MAFSTEQVADLYAGLDDVQPKAAALRERLVTAAFQTEGGREHANHGLARRLGTMARCIERVFELLPPDLDHIPEQVVTTDAVINIQAFIMGAFGCCENIAWIWVHERDVRENDKLLPANRIGLGPGYKIFRQSLTPSFRQRLDPLTPWFELLKDFRDALAHRIPLYIPPSTVAPEDGDKYVALEAAFHAALMRRDFAGYERRRTEWQALQRFTPIMTHSLQSPSRPIIFHPQLLADFATIEELAGILLELAL
jgi:hypothetical protein